MPPSPEPQHAPGETGHELAEPRLLDRVHSRRRLRCRSIPSDGGTVHRGRPLVLFRQARHLERCFGSGESISRTSRDGARCRRGDTESTSLLTLVAERGLDPYLGSLHVTHHDHPALASDLIEEFRALTVDAVVLRLLPSDRTSGGDFAVSGGAGCRIGLPARKAFITTLEGKLQSAVAHPLGGADGDYRRAMRAQLAHWIQVLRGEAPAYRPFSVR